MAAGRVNFVKSLQTVSLSPGNPGPIMFRFLTLQQIQ